MRRTVNVYRSEAGAVLIQVGLSILVLMALNVFVADYGMWWVARTQAQNAADAGALAAVTGLTYDSYVPGQTWATTIKPSAEAIATLSANAVWQSGASAVASNTCPAGVTGTCATVSVYRNGTNGSTPLPMMFGPILNITSQGVRAQAAAALGAANTTTCLKPWALPDKWQTDLVAPVNEFKAYGPGAVPLSPADAYTPPDGSQASSRTLSADYGALIRFDVNRLNNPLTDPITRGAISEPPAYMLPLTLTTGHLNSMRSCNGQQISIGQLISIDMTMVAGGAGLGLSAAQEQFDRDSGADWNSEAGGYVERSCAPGCTPFSALSPRLWAVALYNPAFFDQQRMATPPWPACPGNAPCVQVSNIAGFFIDYMDPSAPNGRHGHLVRYPGISVSGPTTIVENGSWLVQPRLIR